MPRILYIHHNSHAIGGADYCLVKMVKAVHQSRKFQCMVLLRQQTAVESIYRAAGIPVIIKRFYRLDKKSLSLLLLPFFALYEIFSICRLIKKHRIELIHTNDLFDFVGNLAARLCGVPSCQSVRTILRVQKIYNRLVTWLCCHTSERLLCVSTAVRQMMFPHCPEKAVVLHDWVDFAAVQHDHFSASSLREELGLPEDAILIGCIGRIVPRKGQDIFLSAAEMVAPKNDRLYFVIVGDPEQKSTYYKHLRQNWKRSPQKERIFFLPGRSNIRSLMSQLNIVVNSSTYPDPFPNVILEAMSCGCCVIGANEGGMPEQIENGVTGFLFTARDATSLSHTIERAIQALAAGVIRPSVIQKRIQDRFAAERRIAELLAIYDELLVKTK